MPGLGCQTADNTDKGDPMYRDDRKQARTETLRRKAVRQAKTGMVTR